MLEDTNSLDGANESFISCFPIAFSLGSSHDGESKSFACSKSNNYIMSYLAFFYETTAYKINPWRFSMCSIEAMKKYINGLGRFVNSHILIVLILLILFSPVI